MSKIIEIMQSKPSFYAEKGASVSQIEQAEKNLGLKFASDFKEYTQEFGAASFDGHELTGFSSDRNLCVVEVTQKNRIKSNVQDNLYVIEEAHIDGIVVWQDSDGVVYETSPGSKAIRIANSLADYISK
jgi:cell wall assembly/cell proliferation coordinating protein, KNR4-like protein